MSWSQILIALAVPSGLGLLAAWPLWRWKQMVVGNAVGAGVAFVLTIGLIGLSYVTESSNLGGYAPLTASWSLATNVS